MVKLKCGCTPDASGYGYCGECTKALRKKIWKEMSPKRKAYDRHMDPVGSRELDDEVYGDGCCSCHIDAPCSYCMNKPYCGKCDVSYGYDEVCPKCGSSNDEDEEE